MEAYDALVLLSFGGPEGPDDVMPFLRNVTRGRQIPDDRIAEVAEHYARFGGVSPINGLNRELLAAIGADLHANGVDLPVYWGNRNWAPYLVDVVRQMRDDGIRRALAFVTSAYSSASSCRQYLGDIETATAEVDDAPVVTKLRAYFNHPGFIEPMVDAVRVALDELPASARSGAHLAFVAHSIPSAMNAASGPGGGAYATQLVEAARLVAEAVGGSHPWQVVYCSRSGSPATPWLEPDIGDHLVDLHRAGAPAVVIAPIGFVSDHLEVVYDLDFEALAKAAELGLPAARAATAGRDARFVAMVRELVAEQTHGATARFLGTLGPAHQVCPPQCCLSAGRG